MNSIDPSADLSWLLDNFVRETPGVECAQTMSSDGMHLAASSAMNEVQCDQFAAISSGLVSLGDSARDVFGHAPLIRTIIETESGWILITRVSNLASLALICGPDADLGLIGYELTGLVDKAGAYMSPEQVKAMQKTFAA